MRLRWVDGCASSLHHLTAAIAVVATSLTTSRFPVAVGLAPVFPNSLMMGMEIRDKVTIDGHSAAVH